MSPAGRSAALPRLLAGMRTQGPMTLAHHTEIHGALPTFARRRREAASALVHELERSGLQGRGGAGFPTATKLKAVAAARGRAIVVANACEGEPTSRKDRLLLERLPHLVIDGALLAAQAVDAGEVLIAADETDIGATLSVDRALRERSDGSRDRPRVRLVTVPRGYVTGQESAVVNFINRGSAKPTATPPPIYQRGVRGRPTLINNVETLAQIALIERHGATWFRELGSHAEPGSTLVTLTGAVSHPGVFEIETGATVASLMNAAGGPTSPLRAFLFGGYAGTWVPVEVGYDLTLSSGGLDQAGASLGAGLVFALPNSACPVAEVTNVVRWLAGESSGQCGPCFNGLEAIATALERVSAGGVGKSALDRISRWAALANRRGACAHPDGVVRFVVSALAVFGSEFSAHARRGRCSACRRPRLLPTIMPPPTRAAA
jgi:NADH:ubiquinone oxidoreductase subunit F (NADH-binding)